ncbi:MAG: hypothetical protein HZB53_15800 [Chloroflexi bacterium]|nr:hypothetical protein [Chloroflexota bacterium]
MPQEFNSRKHPQQLVRQLITGGVIITIIAALTFAAFRIGGGALATALGVFGLLALVVGLLWLVMKLLEWLGGPED